MFRHSTRPSHGLATVATNQQGSSQEPSPSNTTCCAADTYDQPTAAILAAWRKATTIAPQYIAKFRGSGNGGTTVPASVAHRGAGSRSGPGYFQAPARQLTPSAGTEGVLPAELKEEFPGHARPPRDPQAVVDLCPSNWVRQTRDAPPPATRQMSPRIVRRSPLHRGRIPDRHRRRAIRVIFESLEQE